MNYIKNKNIQLRIIDRVDNEYPKQNTFYKKLYKVLLQQCFCFFISHLHKMRDTRFTIPITKKLLMSFPCSVSYASEHAIKKEVKDPASTCSLKP